MDNLNVRGMMKNRHLSRYIYKQKFYEFKRQIKYKCKKYGIKFIEADKLYHSSKTCSTCDNIKNDLKLSDRIYLYTECNLSIDRDLNATLNLSRYN